MSLDIAAASYLGRSYPAVTATAVTTNAPSRSLDGVQASTDQVTSLLSPVSISSLPLVKLPSDVLAAIQSGGAIRAPDPGKTAAQNSSQAYSVIKDADTGQILGGVWPGAAVVSKLNTPIDSRITGNSDWSQVTQYLAQDIAQFTGKDIAVQYFQPGDPNAPTFASVMAMR